MKWKRMRSSFPLLLKELTEQAVHKRTYIIRVLYASALFLFFCIIFRDELSSSAGSPLQILGSGEEMFEFLVYIQFAGIFIFLPATMSSVLTYEKERDSLALLFLTDLRPWEIIFQKYVGRLIPMFSFLLLSLPLLAISYAFGGISTNYLCSGVLLLFLTCLQVGAFAIMFSSYFRTTSEAFVASYLGGGVFYLVLSLFDVVAHAFRMRGWYLGDAVQFAFLPPVIFSETEGDSFGVVLVRSIPIVLSIGVFLVLARVFLIRRAFVLPRRLVLRVFGRLDRFYNRVNKFVGGIVLWKGEKPLPEDEPIAWREINKRALGKLDYLVRFLVLIEVPVFFTAVAVLLGRSSWRGQAEALSVIVFVLWFIAVLPMTVKNANAIVSERTRQTLDVLLVTPLSGKEIVLQKTRALKRFTLIMLVPFLTVFLLEAWCERGGQLSGRYPAESSYFAYMIPSILSVLIYIPMFSWVSFWVGLKARTRSRAIIGALCVIVVWNVVPPMALALLSQFTRVNVSGLAWSHLLLLSPATMIAHTEFTAIDGLVIGPWGAIIGNFLWHGFILFYFRRLCLENADRYLGRLRTTHDVGYGTKAISAPGGS